MKLPIPALAALVVGLAAGTYMSPARTAVPPHEEGADSASSESAPVPVIPQPVSDLPPAATSGSEEPATELESLRAAVAELSPTEAAPMVARLSDDDAIGILKAMPLSRASELLEAMPRDRGSELSRLLLLAGTGT